MGVIVLLVSTGRSADPSFSHVIAGIGFPWNSQLRVTLVCSRVMMEFGLDRTVTPTEGGGGGGGEEVDDRVE